MDGRLAIIQVSEDTLPTTKKMAEDTQPANNWAVKTYFTQHRLEDVFAI